MCTLMHYVTLGVINLCHLVAYTIIFLFRQATAIWFAYKKLFCKDVFWYVNIWAYILGKYKRSIYFNKCFPTLCTCKSFLSHSLQSKTEKFFINSKWKFLGKSKIFFFLFFAKHYTSSLSNDIICFIFFFWT